VVDAQELFSGDLSRVGAEQLTSPLRGIEPFLVVAEQLTSPPPLRGLDPFLGVAEQHNSPLLEEIETSSPISSPIVPCQAADIPITQADEGNQDLAASGIIPTQSSAADPKPTGADIAAVELLKYPPELDVKSVSLGGSSVEFTLVVGNTDSQRFVHDQPSLKDDRVDLERLFQIEPLERLPEPHGSSPILDIEFLRADSSVEGPSSAVGNTEKNGGALVVSFSSAVQTEPLNPQLSELEIGSSRAGSPFANTASSAVGNTGLQRFAPYDPKPFPIDDKGALIRSSSSAVQTDPWGPLPGTGSPEGTPRSAAVGNTEKNGGALVVSFSSAVQRETPPLPELEIGTSRADSLVEFNTGGAVGNTEKNDGAVVRSFSSAVRTAPWGFPGTGSPEGTPRSAAAENIAGFERFPSYEGTRGMYAARGDDLSSSLRRSPSTVIIVTPRGGNIGPSSFPDAPNQSGEKEAKILSTVEQLTQEVGILSGAVEQLAEENKNLKHQILAESNAAREALRKLEQQNTEQAEAAKNNLERLREQQDKELKVITDAKIESDKKSAAIKAKIEKITSILSNTAYTIENSNFIMKVAELS
jgi:hypothetical protein